MFFFQILNSSLMAFCSSNALRSNLPDDEEDGAEGEAEAAERIDG